MKQVEAFLAEGQTLTRALVVIGLAKSSYFNKPKPRPPQSLNTDVVSALDGLGEREGVYGVPEGSKSSATERPWLREKDDLPTFEGPGAIAAPETEGVQEDEITLGKPALFEYSLGSGPDDHAGRRGRKRLWVCDD